MLLGAGRESSQVDDYQATCVSLFCFLFLFFFGSDRVTRPSQAPPPILMIRFSHLLSGTNLFTCEPLSAPPPSWTLID
ncbi:Hypothetical predicted protein [Drosophila guanche]|uniref:Uncharacterized protein n=1 Tax=Drosophila guanche TaxID=7266 RepID=A0A3B0K085_DROGU|nr:Hypothetical predicted protein [Drosophila guanche]